MYSCTIRILPDVDVFPVFLRNDTLLLCSLANLRFRYKNIMYKNKIMYAVYLILFI